MTVSTFTQKNLTNFNTFGLKCVANHYAEVSNADALPAVLAEIPLHALVLSLGGGSNMILDQEIPHYTIHYTNRDIQVIQETESSVMVQVGAGMGWHEWVMYSIQQGWYGLENLALIPGTVGAAPIQNIGAYGTEVADTIYKVQAIHYRTGELLDLPASACAFGYRHSIFKKLPALITSVQFVLPKKWQPNFTYPELRQYFQADPSPSALSVAQAVINIRQRKLPDPVKVGNVGSFFKNPVLSTMQFLRIQQRYPDVPSYPQKDGTIKIPAAWLIEKCGWKDRPSENVAVHPKQALILINLGGASFQDVANYSKHIQEDVQQTFGVALQTEPDFISGSV